MMATAVTPVTAVTDGITYKIFYKNDENVITSIESTSFYDGDANRDKIKDFKLKLKELLVKRDDKPTIIAFITKLVEIATEKKNILTNNNGDDDKGPFIFVIDKNFDSKLERTIIIFIKDDSKQLYTNFYNTYQQDINFDLFDNLKYIFYKEASTLPPYPSNPTPPPT